MKTLNDIILYKKEEIKQEKLIIEENKIDEIIKIKEKPRGFSYTLIENNKNFGIIAEIKKASPSKGIIRKSFDPVQIAEEYKESGATCLSILTDKHFFQGDNEFIEMIKKKVDLPVLRKDFIIDRWQIKQSRYLNADCILLILSCLNLNQAKEFEHEAMELGMDVLIEAHSIKEIEISNQFKSNLIGINNRNLRTMVVNINNSINLIKYLDKEKIAISESGINEKNDLIKLNRCGFKNFLIGEMFMKQNNIKKVFTDIFNDF